MSIRKEEEDIWIMMPSRLQPGGQNTKWGTLRIGMPHANHSSASRSMCRDRMAPLAYQSTKYGLGSRRITRGAHTSPS